MLKKRKQNILSRSYLDIPCIIYDFHVVLSVNTAGENLSPNNDEGHALTNTRMSSVEQWLDLM